MPRNYTKKSAERKQVAVYFLKEEYERLVALATVKGSSLSDFIRNLFNQHGN